LALGLLAWGMAGVGRRAARDAAVRNDPIGGRGMDGGGSAIGAGEQRPYRRPDGGGGDVAVRRVVRGVGLRNNPIGGIATGEKSAIGAGAPRPYAQPDGDDVAARRADGIAETRNDPIPGNAAGEKFAIGTVASRPQARPDGAGDDLAAGAGPGAACGAGMAAAGGAGLGALGMPAAGLLGTGWRTSAGAGNNATQREAVRPASVGLRAGLLGTSSLDGSATAVRVRGGMPALIAAVAAGGDVQAAFDALCS